MSQTMREALMSLARREDTNLTWADRVLIGKVIAALSAPSNEQAQQGEGFGAEVAKQAVNVAWPELASRPAAAAPAAQAYMCQETETPCTRCTSTCEAALAGAAQVDELRENFEALDLRNHVLERGMQALMARLASLLDEDQFKDCEDIVRRAGIEAPAIGVTLEDVRQACADADIPEDIESRLLAALAGAAHESGCKGGECKHASDCAVHCSDDPRPCDCGAAQGAEPAPDPMNYKEMFLAAVAALAEIDALLGLPEDGCNDPQVTVSALKDYIAGAKETAAYRDQWVDAQYAEAAQGAEPAGWRLVPIVATPEMVANAMRECGGIGAGSYGEHSGADGDDMRSVWDSMLAAAPQSPTGTEKKA